MDEIEIRIGNFSLLARGKYALGLLAMLLLQPLSYFGTDEAIAQIVVELFGP